MTENINSLADSLQSIMLHEHQNQKTQHESSADTPDVSPTCVAAPSRLSNAYPCSSLPKSRRRRTCDDAPPTYVKNKHEYSRRRTCDDAISGYVKNKYVPKKHHSKSSEGTSDNSGQKEVDELIRLRDASFNISTSSSRGSPMAPPAPAEEKDAPPPRKSGGERRRTSWTLNRSLTLKPKSTWEKSRRHTVDTEGNPTNTAKKKSSSGNGLSHMRTSPPDDSTVPSPGHPIENDVGGAATEGAPPPRKSGGERRRTSWTLNNRSLTKKSARKKSRRRTVDTEGLSSSEMSLSLDRLSELNGPNFDLGDTLSSTEYQIIEPNPAKALHLVQQLQVHDFAWVRRSTHKWTYGIVADFPQHGDGEEASIRFVIDKLGHTKTFTMKHWAAYIRLVDDTVIYC